MKTDLERICEVARMGGCECIVDDGLLYVEISNGETHLLRPIDAVVRQEMLRAFDEAMFRLGLYAKITPPLSGDGVKSLVWADDRHSLDY